MKRPYQQNGRSHIKLPEKGDKMSCGNWRGITQIRSCSDNICTLRIIIDQAIEWQNQ